MSAYDDLHDRCMTEITGEDSLIDGVHAVLAEVLRTLETVTPEMFRAWGRAATLRTGDGATRDWLAMLHASPLAPPK